MRRARYQVTINGFHVNRETYDDLLEFDGKRDEVFAQWANTKIDADGQVVYSSTGRTPTMGDVNNLPGRINAGTASTMGGLRTGDSFPHDMPWLKRRDFEIKHPAFLNLPPVVIKYEPRLDRPVPPLVLWEGDLTEKETLVVVPMLWEFDQGPGLLQRFINWHAAIDAEFGDRAKTLFGSLPAVGVVFDAVQLGIDTAQFLTTVTGTSGSRPIGMKLAAGTKHTYEPKILVLSVDRIEEFLADNPTGKGSGVGMIQLDDETEDLQGKYDLYWQVERIGAVSDVPERGPKEGSQAGWRWCSKCQGLFYGPLQGVSACSQGGPHEDPEVSGSGTYALRFGVPEGPDIQTEWRWCNRCQGLFFGPMHDKSICPRGGTHAAPDVSGSSNYALAHNMPESFGYQGQWRWCPRCTGLYFGPQRDASVCPAGGNHGSSPASESANYLLPHL